MLDLTLPEGKSEGFHFLHELVRTIGYLSSKYYQKHGHQIEGGKLGCDSTIAMTYDFSAVALGIGPDKERIYHGVKVEYGMEPCQCGTGKVAGAVKITVEALRKLVNDVEKTEQALQKIKQDLIPDYIKDARSL